MTSRTLKFITVSAQTIVAGTLIAACATPQENPNYEISTKYKASSPYAVANANTGLATPPQYVPAQYANANVAPGQYPQSAPAYPAPSAQNVQIQPQYSQAVIYPTANYQTAQSTTQTTTRQAPTDQEYGETFGTPGYHAVQSANGGTTAPAQPNNTAQYVPPRGVQSQAPVAQAPIAQAPQYRAPTPNPVRPQAQPAPRAVAPSYSDPAYGTRSHVVMKDDTVYSLSRSVCSDIETVRRMNNLDANFGISIGQTLTLPASRC